jgi:thiol-disulfide isomerase/thioredoxin
MDNGDMNAANGVPAPLGLLRRRQLLAALAAVGLGGARGAAAQGERSTSILRPWPAQRAAPPLRLRTLDGAPWDLAALKGQLVVLNFWASWCEPCRSEMPSLELLAQRHEGDGVAVIAVNVRESEAVIERFLQTMPISLPIVRDADGSASAAWTPRVLPSTVVIARNGQPQFTVIGEADWTGAAARRWIAPYLGRGNGAPASATRTGWR